MRALTLFGFMATLALCGTPQVFAQGFASQVRVAKAEERAIAPQIEVNGTVISLNDSRLSVEVEGQLVEALQPGNRVEKGAMIARIDDRLLRLAVRQARAALTRLEANQTFRKQDVARLEDLTSRDNASKARLEEAQSQLAMLGAEIEDAKAQLERAEGNLERAVIRAPFSGVIVERLANTGQYMTIGQAVVRLVDTSNIEVALPAPITVAPFIKVGTGVQVTSHAGVQDLTVRTVVPVGDAVSRMVEVRLEADSKDWLIGTPVKVSLPREASRRTVAVPRDAMVLKNGTAYIFIVGDDSTAKQVTVDPTSAEGNWLVPASGVKAGDKVIIRGAERLFDGAQVQILNP